MNPNTNPPAPTVQPTDALRGKIDALVRKATYDFDTTGVVDRILALLKPPLADGAAGDADRRLAEAVGLLNAFCRAQKTWELTKALEKAGKFIRDYDATMKATAPARSGEGT